jgi:hypothetical protein
MGRDRIIKQVPKFFFNQYLKVIDERRRIIWQWRTLALIIDRFLLLTFSFITFLTVTVFIIFPIFFRERFLAQNFFSS